MQTKRLRFMGTLSLFIILLVTYIGFISFSGEEKIKNIVKDNKKEVNTITSLDTSPSAGTVLAEATTLLPTDTSFELMAESNILRLKVDRFTGHFIIEDKRNGKVISSYPNTRDWPNENSTKSWKEHLKSPIMIEYVELNKVNSNPKLTDFIKENGRVTNFKPIEGGGKSNLAT